MSKIRLMQTGSWIYISYNDYPEKRQLKDFYKLYKKASGFIVKEYREEGETILAITENATSVLIGCDAEKGCFIRSGRSDIREAVKAAFDILCYRYSGYSGYREVLARLGDGTMKEALDLACKRHEELADDQETYEDVRELMNAWGSA